MPVILKDMDEPEDCADCPFVVKTYADEFASYASCMCSRTGKDVFRYVYFSKIPDNCPISQVKDDE